MNEIKKKFMEIFLGDLTNEEKKDIYFNQYMWHAYSYKKLEAQEGYVAIETFKKCKQNGVYIFFEHNDEVIEKDSISFEELLNNLEKWGSCDYYVVDKGFKWAFISTHETIYYDEFVKTNYNNKQHSYYIGPFFALSPKK